MQNVNYKKKIDSFKNQYKDEKGKFNPNNFVIIIGLSEYADIAAIRDDKIFNCWGMAHTNFEGFLYEIPIKKLDIKNTFTIMELKTFKTIIKQTKKELVSKITEIKLEIDIRQG